MGDRPTVFVGSSSEGLEIARAVQFQLRDDALVTVWSDGVFGLSQGTLEALVTNLDRYDFAVLVITPDDVVSSRDVEKQAPRDNVMFELGLFMGRLGGLRTFAVCSNAENLKLPSDLAGVTVAQFDEGDARDEVVSALGPACFQLRKAMEQLGLSDRKRLLGIQNAAGEVEGMSEQLAHLLSLLVRSRKLELEVTLAQFGALLPRESSEALLRDLQDLEVATARRQKTD